MSRAFVDSNGEERAFRNEPASREAREQLLASSWGGEFLRENRASEVVDTSGKEPKLVVGDPGLLLLGIISSSVANSVRLPSMPRPPL